MFRKITLSGFITRPLLSINIAVSIAAPVFSVLNSNLPASVAPSAVALILASEVSVLFPK